MHLQTGADLGFSRGGGGGVADFQKIFENFDDLFFLFFRSIKLIFRALPKHGFVPILAKFFASQAKFWKNRSKKAFLGTFWKILTEKLRFFGARSPLKISIYWRQRRLQKIFRVDRPKMDFLKVSKGGPFGSAGDRIPGGGGVRPFSAPLNPPLPADC